MAKNMNIFISHSSRNIEIVEHFCAALCSLGINKDSIFCSSIPGQGVNNGQKLNDGIHNAIASSGLLIYFISYDFIHSAYCMEELGIGWYISQQQQVDCYYLLIPDIAFSEIEGFVNSNIDKFTVVSAEHKDDFGLLLENICEKTGIAIPKHSALLNIEKVFYDAIHASLANTIARRKELQLLAEKQTMRENDLNDKISELEAQIEKYEAYLLKYEAREEAIQKHQERRELYAEFSAIRSRFHILGVLDGISKTAYESMKNKEFFLSMAYRYIELENIFGEHNPQMELLLACIFSHEGLTKEAYSHLIEYVKYNNHNIFPSYFRHINVSADNDMHEIIEILEEKTKEHRMGVVLDSYKETICTLKNTKRGEECIPSLGTY